MGIAINTNVQSLSAQRALTKVKKDQGQALERLASGSRINRAGDDAAGLAISENLKANIRSSRQASRNASDGISMIQVAEGGLNEVSNILIRLRELSIQSSSDTIGNDERKFTDLEFQNLMQEVERISQSTRYNEQLLLNGQGDKFDFQIGIRNSPEYDRISYNAGEANSTTEGLNLGGMGVSEKVQSQENLETIDGAIKNVNGQRANLGALQNRLSSTVENLLIQTENLSAANSRIRDTDVAEESAELARANILDQATPSVLAQANQSKRTALGLISG